ncbi:WD-repeat protein 3, putative [Brugia malayi]|uniref:Bm3356 n=1 Tax=Brugia malayi TaxID=6279 RepID=A0A0K0J9X7_BRUMA|nr:WD-repeat protein 3, putative [Brugia malayi]CRZ22899.1 Bm3356 [Brugia malayi]VIO93080.1 WD-repeat protein 3, putative [Brugia malayi]
MGLTKQYLRYTHDGTCNVVASSSGTVAAITDNICAVSACENVHFYNMRKGEKVDEIRGSNKCVSTIKFSGNRRFLAVGYVDGTTRLYDRKSDDRSMYVTFSGHRTGVNCIAFSKDGLTLATGGKDSAVVIWDIVNESGLFRLNGHKNSVTHLQFTLDGRFLISSSKDSYVKFWSLDSRSCFFTITDCHSEVYTFSLLKNDTFLLVGSAELELRVFELNWLEKMEMDDEDNNSTKKLKASDNSVEYTEDTQANNIVRCVKKGQILRRSKGRTLQLAVSRDEKLIACVGSLHCVDIFRIYDDDESQKRLMKKLRKARKKSTESGDVGAISETDIAKDVTILISRIGEYKPNGKVKWIDFSSAVKRCGDEILQYQLYILYAENTVLSETMLVDFKSNEVQFADLADLNQLGHRTDVRCLAVAESGFSFVSGSAESAIVWNLHSLKISHTLEDEQMADITASLFVTGDKHIILATKEGNIFLFELATNEMLEMIKKAHDGAVWQLIPTPDKRGFVSCGNDKTVRYWNYELVSEGTRKRLSVKPCRVLEVPDEALCVAASNDSRFLAVGLLDNTACVHFVDTFKFFVSLYGHSLPVTAIHISYDNKLVATGSADKSVKIWGLDFGDCHKSFHAHDDIVTCVLFSPEENLLWSAGKDGLIKQWDAVKFERIQVLNLHSAEIRALAQTTNGKYVISSSHDKSIRLWELTEEIIVLQEEEAMEREKEYEKRLIQLNDVVPGEEKINEAEIAVQKTIASIKSTEDIIEALEIMRNEKIAMLDDPKHEKHPLLSYFESASLDHFVLDVIQRVPSSHLEKSLLMVPFGFVPDIIRALGVCIGKRYKAELATRVLIFIVKIHHNYLITQTDLITLFDDLCRKVPRGLDDLRDICGFNLAALKLFQKEVEEESEVKMFADFSELGKKTKKKSRKTVTKVFA